MYAPYHYAAFHDPSAVGSGPPQPPPPPQPQSYLHYPADMNDPNAIHQHQHQHQHHPHPHPHHYPLTVAPRLPALQVTHPQPSKLRSRRELASDSPSRSAAPPLITANMTPEEEAAAREEARKARKREMGRERQRRKRLRDKAKREAEKVRERMEAAGHMSEPGMHPSALQIPFGRHANTSRASLSSLSVGSYDSVPSSASTSYSTLPPMSMTISPTNSFAMSASSTSYSDASSPSQSFSPTLSASHSLSGFASDSSWNEHTAVFGNLTLSGDQDATVRAPKASRTSGAHLNNIAGTRRTPPEADYTHFAGPSKRRKSDFDDEHQVGLGVMDWQTRPGGQKSRRPVSVPDGIVLESVHGPSRSPSPPPHLAADMSRPDYRGGPYSAASPEGVYFANSVVQGLHETQWGGMLHTKLGIQQGDLDRMSPDFAGVYERWRVENNMTQYFLDPDTRAHVMSSSSAQSPTSPRASAFVTPNPPRREGDRPTSSTSEGSMAAPPGGTMHLGQAHPPATPQSKAGSSTATSPVNPALQTPAGHSQPMFPPPQDYNQQWSSAPQPSRGYDPEWQRGNFAHTLSSPMTGGDPKEPSFNIPPPPPHGPLHPHMNVQTGYVNTAEYQTPASAGPRGAAPPFTPATPVRPAMSGPPSGVPLFYNPQFHQPLGTPVQGSPSQQHPKDGDMFLAQQQQPPQQP